MDNRPDSTDLRALAEAATPGPWESHCPNCNLIIGGADLLSPLPAEQIAEVFGHDTDEPNRAYIVAACNALPSLLDRLDKAEDLLRETLGNLGHDLNCHKRLPGQECTCFVDDLEARIDAAAHPSDGYMRCDKCGQRLVGADGYEDDPYCLNCETCPRCHEVHHMGDRCAEAARALGRLATLEAVVKSAARMGLCSQTHHIYDTTCFCHHRPPDEVGT